MGSMIRAGVSSVELAFETGLPLAGFAARHEPSTGVHDPLSARALAVSDELHDTILVVADLTSMAPEQAKSVRDRIAAATGVDGDAISVAVTHTHSAPNIDPWMTTPVAPREVWKRLESTLATVGIDAWRARGPATIAHATGTAALTANRRRPDGPKDETLDVLRFDDIDGVPLAIAFVYACHPTVIGPSNTLLSADWPAQARAEVESAFEGATAIFIQGFCGDCNAGHSAHASMDGTSPPSRTASEAARLGARIGRAVIALAGVASPAAGHVDFETHRFGWRWATADARTLSDLRADASPADLTMRGLARVWQERLANTPEQVTEELSVSCFTWGRAVLVQVSGEPFAELGLEMRRMLPGVPVIPIGYANGVPGYLPYPRHERDLGGYEPDEAHIVYGRPHCMPDWFARNARDIAAGCAVKPTNHH